MFVGPAHGGVKRSVPFAFVNRVAFETFLVEKIVYDFVCIELVGCSH